MLKWPIRERIIERDGRTVIVRPGKWSFRDVVAMLDMAAQLAASACAAMGRTLPHGVDPDALPDHPWLDDAQ